MSDNLPLIKVIKELRSFRTHLFFLESSCSLSLRSSIMVWRTASPSEAPEPLADTFVRSCLFSRCNRANLSWEKLELGIDRIATLPDIRPFWKSDTRFPARYPVGVGYWIFQCLFVVQQSCSNNWNNLKSSNTSKNILLISGLPDIQPDIWKPDILF